MREGEVNSFFWGDVSRRVLPSGSGEGDDMGMRSDEEIEKETDEDVRAAKKVLGQLMTTPEGRALVESTTTGMLPTGRPKEREEMLERLRGMIWKGSVPRIGKDGTDLICELVASGESLTSVCDELGLLYVDVARMIGRFSAENYRVSVEVRDGFRREWVLGELFSDARAEMAECFDENGAFKRWGDIPRRTRRAIEGFDSMGRGVKVKLRDKTRTMKMIGQELGMFSATKKGGTSVLLSEIFEKLDALERREAKNVVVVEPGGELIKGTPEAEERERKRRKVL